MNGEKRDYEKHTDIESPVKDIDQSELEVEITELEAELETELDGDVDTTDG
jgi:hypothetical protein